MNSIVKELRDWTTTNAAMLARSGVQVTEKPPEPGSTHPWKASVALVFDEVIVSFSVWERTLFQSELIVSSACFSPGLASSTWAEQRFLVSEVRAALPKQQLRRCFGPAVLSRVVLRQIGLPQMVA
jgi:hypothetical protein